MAASSLDISFNNAMGSHLNDFFHSLQADSGSALNSFLSSLSTFSTSIQTHRNVLKDETLLAARNFASIIDTVATNVLELEKASDKIGENVSNDLLKILGSKIDKLAISDTYTPEDTSAFPAYIKPSYMWLLDNLHNPYPSKEFKKQLSRQTSCSVKDIDAWFIDVRRRIGWNKLRKTHFSNKQGEIIAAATNFFKPSTKKFASDLTHTLSSELGPYDFSRGHFIILEKAAKSLYRDRFPDLVSSIDLHINVSPHVTALATSSAENVKAAGLLDDSPHLFNNQTFSYPSPAPSSSDPIDELSLPISLPSPKTSDSHSRKRRRSSSDPFFTADIADVTSPSQNRPRLEPPCVTIDAAASLPSPANTVDDSDDVTENQILSTVAAEPSLINKSSPLKRKRRLSDGDCQNSAKRPHNALCLPRLQTVSYSSPMRQPLLEDLCGNWLLGNEDSEPHLSDVIPSPATAEDPSSLGIPLNIDFCPHNFSPYKPELYFPETFIADLDCVAPGAPQSPSSGPEPSCALEHISYTDSLQDAGFCFAESMQFGLAPAPYQLDFQCDQPQVSREYLMVPNSELLSLSLGYIPYSSQSLGDSCRNLESLDRAPLTKTAILGNHNHLVPHLNSQELEAKRARAVRAQALREELALYEAEGL